MFDEHAEEPSFPQIYLVEPRRVDPAAQPIPFTFATSEIRRSDRRGVVPEHVLYMAMRVLRFWVSHGLFIAFHATPEPDHITYEMQEQPSFLENAVDNDLAFMKGVPNTVNCWQQQKRDVLAMIRQLGQLTVFLALLASELHWPHLLSLLERLQKNNPDLEIDPADMHALIVPVW